MQSIFPSWDKAPNGLLEIKEQLAASGPGGWRPNRLILQNYWRFGYEEFHFVQGRLVLRGANGSGKSTVLVSAITLVLDMEKRRERLDTFGGQGRGAAYYLVGEPDASPESEFYHFERTGYVALEFTNPGGEYRTIGVGLYTTRNRPDLAVDAWGFIIADGRRVGSDLHLYDNAKLPLSARALRDTLGSGGLVLERSAEYQAQVNAHLFGFAAPAEYEFLLSLLLQLRSPKLNKDTRPSDIRAMLTDSLPPLPADLLSQAVQIIEDIDHCLEHLEETQAQYDSIVAVDDSQATYLNQLAQREAVEYLAAELHLHEARQAEQESEAQLNQAQERLHEIQDALTRNSTAERQALGRLDVLENHEAFREQKTLETLTSDLEQASQAVGSAERSLQQSEAALKRAQERQQEQLRRWQHLRQTLGQQSTELRGAATEASWPLADEQAQRLVSACTDLAPERPPSETPFAALVSVAATKAAAQERERALRRVREALASEEAAQQKHRETIAAVERERQALDEAGQQLVQAEEAFATRRHAATEAVQAWSSQCAADLSGRSALDETLSALAGFEPEDKATALHSIRLPLLHSIDARRQWLGDQAARTRVLRQRQQEDRQELARQLTEWEGEKDPVPLRRPSQEEARHLLAAHGIAAYPLYAACEFLPTLSPEVAATVEQTLDEAGLLDALVTPLAAADQVAELLESAGLGDRWLNPQQMVADGATTFSSTLLSLIQPVSEHPVSEVVRTALTAIAWFDSAAALEASEAPYAVAPGAWRMGVLHGRAERRRETSVLYIGEANRRRHREEIMARLKEQISDLDARIWDLTEELDTLQKQLDKLHLDRAALENLPQWNDLWAAALGVRTAAEQIQRWTKSLQQAELEANRCYEALVVARSAVQQALRDAPEARGRNQEGLVALINASQRYVDMLYHFLQKSDEVSRLRDDLDQAVADIESAQSRRHSDDVALSAARHHADELTARQAAVVEHLQRLGVDMMRLHQEISELKGTLSRLRLENDNLRNQQGKAEADINAATGLLKRARLHLGEQVIAEAEQRQRLLVSLQAYPTLAKHQALYEAPDTGPRAAAQELLRARRTDEARLRDAIDKSIRDALQQLTTAVSDHRSILAEYGPELLDGVARFRDMGTELPPYRLRRKLESDLAIQRQLLHEKETELYENIILREIARHIRERIALAQTWCDEVNDLLTQQQLSNGEKLSIQWRTCPPDRLSGHDPGRTVALLRRDVETLTDDEVSELVEHFRQRVGEVRSRYRDDTLGDRTFAAALEEVLDYRSWFEFRILSKLPNEERKELTDMRFAARSGGEKSLAMFIPILAAVHARYKAAAPQAPRLIGLDEAFAGVDEHNISAMFRFLVELGFSWIMTSEKLWGVGDALPGCSTYELVKGAGGIVTPVWFVWDGRQLNDALTLMAT